jgi:segregation and condensation protein A
MQDLNFEIASEFLVMAATLIYWKSKAILPKDEEASEDEDDGIAALSEDDLIRQLLEHRRYLAAGQELGEFPKLGEEVFNRPNKRPPVEKVWRNMDVTGLGLSYQDCLIRQKKRSKVLRKETVSLTGKIRFFSERLTVGQATDLRQLMEENPSIGEKVVTFLASLELGKMKKLRLHQQVNYDPIYVELVEKFSSLDLEITSAIEEADRQAASDDGGETPVTESPPDPASEHRRENPEGASV